MHEATTKDRRFSPPALWRRVVLACLIAVASVAAANEAPQVTVLLSDAGEHYRQLADEYRLQLEKHCHGDCIMPQLRVHRLADWQPGDAPDLLVAVGSDAASWAAAGQPGPMLFGLIPEQTWSKLVEVHGSKLLEKASAVYLDQPISRQMRLLRIALPEGHHRVGVLLGPDSAHLDNLLESEAGQQGFRLFIERIDQWQEVGPAVQHLSEQVDVLLAVPDKTVFNRNTLYGILLTSYGENVPVVGYSEALVRAGAMLSLHTTVPDMAQQLAEHTLAFLRDGRGLPAPGPSRHFNISVNHQVAHSLGYHLADPGQLHFHVNKPGGQDAPTSAAK